MVGGGKPKNDQNFKDLGYLSLTSKDKEIMEKWRGKLKDEEVFEGEGVKGRQFPRNQVEEIREEIKSLENTKDYYLEDDLELSRLLKEEPWNEELRIKQRINKEMIEWVITKIVKLREKLSRIYHQF